MKKKWIIDPAHADVFFKVNHMVISTVTGQFTKFESYIESTEKNFSDASFYFSADVDSIDTKTEERDKHLKSADFFDSSNFHKITFKSTTGLFDNKITGNLTIKNITKEITLYADFKGIIKDPSGKDRAGFDFSGKINRKDFGLNWSETLETGNLIVGNEVKIQINAEYIEQ